MALQIGAKIWIQTQSLRVLSVPSERIAVRTHCAGVRRLGDNSSQLFCSDRRHRALYGVLSWRGSLALSDQRDRKRNQDQKPAATDHVATAASATPTTVRRQDGLSIAGAAPG